MPMETAFDHGAADQRETTREIAEWVCGFSDGDLTPSAKTWAVHAILDWVGVTVAGAREPLSEILSAQYGETDGPCTIIAQGRRARVHDASLVNGAAGHALDYDDVNYSMHGHPTVPVAPVVMALGEEHGKTPHEVLRAFVAGYEVECAIGLMAGNEHYDNGFHVTGTMGTFGACAAACNLLGLNVEQTRYALGIAASQASGLKANFGTMTKPFHAGKAAMNGVIAAQIAARGFTAGDNAIEAAQGFVDATAPGFRATTFRANPHAPFEVEKTLFKYHASCYLTHSTIEAVAQLRDTHGIALDDLAKLTIYMPPANRRVCDIADPATGLEIKFSIRHLAIMALAGLNTADLGIYTDANAQDAAFARARAKTQIEHRELGQRCAGAVLLETQDGRTMIAETDVGVPATDVAAQWTKLEAKALANLSGVFGTSRAARIVDHVRALEQARELTPLLRELA